MRVRNWATSYVDSNFFEQAMGEAATNDSSKEGGALNQDRIVKSYPVKVETVRLQWLMEMDGQRLLE